jgi:hypothetical protein
MKLKVRNTYVTKEGKSGFRKVGSGLGLGEAGWAGSAEEGQGFLGKVQGSLGEEVMEAWRLWRP